MLDLGKPAVNNNAQIFQCKICLFVNLGWVGNKARSSKIKQNIFYNISGNFPENGTVQTNTKYLSKIVNSGHADMGLTD